MASEKFIFLLNSSFIMRNKTTKKCLFLACTMFMRWWSVTFHMYENVCCVRVYVHKIELITIRLLKAKFFSFMFSFRRVLAHAFHRWRKLFGQTKQQKGNPFYLVWKSWKCVRVFGALHHGNRCQTLSRSFVCIPKMIYQLCDIYFSYRQLVEIERTLWTYEDEMRKIMKKKKKNWKNIYEGKK